MSETRGAFVLSKVILKKLDDNWVPPEEVFINEPATDLTKSRNFISQQSSFNSGYFGGGLATGSPPTARSTMDKVTYSTDTTVAVPGANLTVARYKLAATGNSTAGYFGGGGPGVYPSPGFRSTMDKVNYSSDTTAAVPGANLSVAREVTGATGNSTAGYFGGGVTGSISPTYSTMDKVTYSTDTRTTVPGAALSSARSDHAATGNSTSGYFGGGTIVTGPGTGIPVSTMDKVTYSTDTRTTVPGAALSSARSDHAATGNSTSGYFGGDTGFPAVAIMDKVTYSTDTRSTVATAALSDARYSFGATGNSTSGYFGGGTPGSTMDKLDYSTEVTSRTPGASLSVARSAPAASSSTANALPQQDITATPQALQGNTGYFGGGFPGPRSTMDKVSYSSDTTAAVPGASLSVARLYPAATGNSTSGYFGGGAAPGERSTMDKVSYSSDTTAAVPGAALSVARYGVSATGNSTSGYFGGGFVSAAYSTMDKVTYSSDTRSTVPGAFLSVARYNLAATGNSTSGYFGGGSPGPFSTMDKVSYSSDTTAVVPGAFLSVARNGLGATGNSTSGYFGGGFPGPRSTMEKVTYSTDTTAAVPGAALSVARGYLAATGNSTAGYFGGGFPTASTMDKVSYSSDTTAAVPGAALSAARYGLAASSSTANAVRGTTPQVPIV
jgi:hypothetical protein